MTKNTRWLSVFLVAVSLTSAAAAQALAAAEPNTVGARLNLLAELRLASSLSVCPGPNLTTSTCASRKGQGPVSGLGMVTVAYTWFIDLGSPSCADESAKTLAYDVALRVAGKGEIRMALSEAECVDVEAVRNQAQSFTIVGGTGRYVGASGAGTVSRSLAQTASGATGVETWSGTLDVPGVEFDVTRPTISALPRRTVLVPARARRVRVTYRVGAQDDVDGAVQVTCAPRSGARFPVGRTTVRCSATDTSGNERTAMFAITVKRRR